MIAHATAEGREGGRTCARDHGPREDWINRLTAVEGVEGAVSFGQWRVSFRIGVAFLMNSIDAWLARAVTWLQIGSLEPGKEDLSV